MYLMRILITWINLLVATSAFDSPYQILRKINRKIIRGRSVDIQDYPYQVKVYVHLKFGGVDHYSDCGGTIITEYIIITAAHCLDLSEKLREFIEYGTSLHALGSGTQIDIKQIFMNNYDPENSHNEDIAILLLDDAIQFSEMAQPIPISYEELHVGDMTDVTGFGILDFATGDTPTHLQLIQLPVVSDEVCMESYNMTRSQFCAGYLDGRGDACSGDSGGPMVFEGKLVGVVSLGVECAKIDYPGVYTSIRAMRDFIQNTLEEIIYSYDSDDSDDSDDDSRLYIQTDDEDEDLEKPVNPENDEKPVNPENDEKPVNPENLEKLAEQENLKLLVKQEQTKLAFSCHICKEASFSKAEELKKHKVQKHPSERLDRIMKNDFNYIPVLELNMCNSCDFKCKESTDMLLHVEKHVNQFKCIKCSISFSNALKFCVHMQEHADDKKYNCHVCNFKSEFRVKVFNHIRKEHFNVFQFYCKICKEASENQLQYRRHMQTHLPNQYECTYCLKSFNRSVAFKKHLITDHNKVNFPDEFIKCPVCDQLVTGKSGLKLHMKQHPTVEDKSYLFIQYSLHFTSKPYKCKLCDKAFGTRHYLKSHERSHEESKKVECPECDKVLNSTNLKKHMLKHSGERPFICPVCSKDFIWRESFSRHKLKCSKKKR